jgi:hypothetical protein
MGTLQSSVHLLVVRHPSLGVNSLYEKLLVASKSKFWLPSQPPLLLVVILVVSSLQWKALQLSVLPFYFCDGLLDYLCVSMGLVLAQLW